MEMRSRLSLDSSWQASAKLNCLLRVINSSGVIMDEPYASERDVVMLIQPDNSSSHENSDPQPCYIGIDSTHLRGYFLSAIELISSSRTVELYSRPVHDYIETSKGSLTEKQDDGTKLYSVQFELPPDFQSTALSLKLLSLQGRKEVCVKELNVIVTEDHGGTRLNWSEEQTQGIAPPLSSNSEPGINLQQMLQSIGASQSVPPFLKSLASSLQLLTLQQSTQTTSGRSDTHNTNTTARDTSDAPHGETGSNIPLELTQMMDAFKQMRPPPQPATVNTTDNDHSQVVNGETEESSSGKGEEASSGHNDDQQETNEHVAKLLEERVSELERRLQGYVDSKLAELEMKLAMKLDKLSGRIDMLDKQSQNMDTKQCDIVKSNGIPLSEDQQLD